MYFVDVSARVAKDRQLKLLETAVAHLNDLVLITEAEPLSEPGPRLVFVNDAFVRETGYQRDEVIGRSPRMMQGAGTDRRELDRIRAALEARRSVRAELVNYRKDGSEMCLEMDIVPIQTGEDVTHFIAVERDVTARRNMESQLRESQRMESLGQLTGGIAHDFNNLLTVILGNAELLAESFEANDARFDIAEMIAGAAQRGAELTQRLLAFARRQTLEPQPTDLNQLVQGMRELLRRALNAQIDIRLELADDLPPALVDPGPLEAALLNLGLNSRDAMPAGGRLTIRTRYLPSSGDCGIAQDNRADGDCVELAVVDTGTGMLPETAARAFEPFFTTKPVGKGTGLGLSMVYGFVKQSNGQVLLESEPGVGTSILIRLPIARLTAAMRPATEVLHGALPQSGGETILLVDDDEMVRVFAASQLRSLGYSVIEADSGWRAEQELRVRPDIDLLFTDVVMPGGMTGRQLSELAQQLRPGLPVLYSSGYAENALAQHGRLDPGIHLLGKPYRRAELAAKVRSVLDASRGRARAGSPAPGGEQPP